VEESHTVGRTALALAVVAVVVANKERLIVNLVGDGFAKAVSRERHCGRLSITGDKL
jgi:hypothetical protein